MCQLSISYELGGRGVLWLTAIEQRFFYPAAAVILAQCAIAFDLVRMGEWACRGMGAVNDFLNFHAAIGGTSIVLGR